VNPGGFTSGVKVEIEVFLYQTLKNFSVCPKLLLNAEHYGFVLAPRLKKGYHQIWEANLQPLGPIFQHFLII
jgi:hypothetical protein